MRPALGQRVLSSRARCARPAARDWIACQRRSNLLARLWTGFRKATASTLMILGGVIRFF
eukprot:1364074-Pleurochrysis_carterae.AAC.2